MTGRKMSSAVRPKAEAPPGLRLPSIEDMQLIVAAADSGSLSQAARQLGTTQPTASWRLEKIEAGLDTELFVRSKQGVHLTRSGRLLVARARQMLSQWEGLASELRVETQEVRGRYSIGVYPTLAAHVMPSFVPALLIEYPDLELAFAHDISREIAQGVIEFRHDLGIVVNPPQHPDLTIVDLYPDEVRLWKAVGVRRKHFGPRVPLIYSPRMPYIDGLLRAARERGVLDAVRHVHSTDLHVITQLTAAGAGVGVLPATIARAEAPEGLVALRKTPVHRDRVALVWRHDAQQTRASRVIREAIMAGVGQKSSTKLEG